MEIVLYIFCGVIFLLFLIFIIGFALPKERIVTRSSVFEVSQVVLYQIVTDNTDWQYRTDLKDLVIIERNGEIETWNEIAKNGAVIKFNTKEKVPFSLYSFTMESNLFSGYWTADFKENDGGGTLLTATEYVRMKNPFIRTLSYLFFNLGSFMEMYQIDLQKKVQSMAST